MKKFLFMGLILLLNKENFSFAMEMAMDGASGVASIGEIKETEEQGLKEVVVEGPSLVSYEQEGTSPLTEKQPHSKVLEDHQKVSPRLTFRLREIPTGEEKYFNLPVRNFYSSSEDGPRRGRKFTITALSEGTIDLNEDVPGCVDNYFRFTLNAWRIAEGWIDLACLVAVTASGFVGGLNTHGDFTVEEKKTLGNISLALDGVAGFLLVLKPFSKLAAQKHRKRLMEVLVDSRPVPLSSFAGDGEIS